MLKLSNISKSSYFYEISLYNKTDKDHEIKAKIEEIFYNQSKNPTITTIKKLCDGLDITLREFFNSTIFDDIEQEIK